MVQKGSKVTMTFQLKDETGQVWDQATQDEPFQYTHGQKEIFNILETEMEGKTKGDTLSVAIPPEQGYGDRDEKLLHELPKEHFEHVKDLKVGMVFQPSEDPNMILRVHEIGEDTVTLDANHPLAGKTLTFDIQVLDVQSD